MKKISPSCTYQDKFSKAQALEMDLKSKVQISTGGGIRKKGRFQRQRKENKQTQECQRHSRPSHSHAA